MTDKQCIYSSNTQIHACARLLTTDAARFCHRLREKANENHDAYMEIEERLYQPMMTVSAAQREKFVAGGLRENGNRQIKSMSFCIHFRSLLN